MEEQPEKMQKYDVHLKCLKNQKLDINKRIQAFLIQ